MRKCCTIKAYHALRAKSFKGIDKGKENSNSMVAGTDICLVGVVKANGTSALVTGNAVDSFHQDCNQCLWWQCYGRPVGEYTVGRPVGTVAVDLVDILLGFAKG